MTDQHTHAGYAPYGGDTTGSFDTDPLFGSLPGGYETGIAYDTGQYGTDQYGTDQYGTGQYDSTQWTTGAQQTAGYDAYATTAYATGYAQPQYDTSGQWDASAWNQPDGATQVQQTPVQQAPVQQTQVQTAPYGYDTTGQWGTPTFDTGAYDATAWNATQLTEQYAAEPYEHERAPEQHHQEQHHQEQPHTEQPQPVEQYEPEHYEPEQYAADPYEPVAHEPDPYEPAAHEPAAHEPAAHGSEAYEPEPEHGFDPGDEPDLDLAPRPEIPVRRVGSGGGSRGRRRTPSKRSALLTIAVPSACVMGVAGIAAASVGGISGGDETQDDRTSQAAADPASVHPVAANNKVDTQLAALSADARDFGDRASRTQERIDLKERQEAEKKKREEEAARKEALRPKYVLPVEQHGLSAYFGQAGVNWMSVHTGIDFPVSYGTTVMAATDGTVRTQYNSAYGNMAIVTSPDGTETWYCHLSSTKIRSGSVKAGDVIAYSGNSGNSTGPHMHFEVRPGGGAAIDPIPWLRSHGINPE
ncbi:peptidase M23 [Streptomyces sp. AcH 505]|uniref:M23 family metallopeptidase n=1 Tax=Streptomyces sp. AcH 505 TaxID=352211 RepID=UPI000591B722|nr:peptidase M23 [Streptomyces sp. AcH 505]